MTAGIAAVRMFAYPCLCHAQETTESFLSHSQTAPVVVVNAAGNCNCATSGAANATKTKARARQDAFKKNVELVEAALKVPELDELGKAKLTVVLRASNAAILENAAVPPPSSSAAGGSVSASSVAAAPNWFVKTARGNKKIEPTSVAASSSATASSSARASAPVLGVPATLTMEDLSDVESDSAESDANNDDEDDNTNVANNCGADATDANTAILDDLARRVRISVLDAEQKIARHLWTEFERKKQQTPSKPVLKQLCVFSRMSPCDACFWLMFAAALVTSTTVCGTNAVCYGRSKISGSRAALVWRTAHR